VAHARDRADFERFAKLTTGHVRLDAQGLSDLEPRWTAVSAMALFYAAKGHVEPPKSAARTACRSKAAGGHHQGSTAMQDADRLDGIVIDCRGLSARDEQPELRGVKGEMIIVETSRSSCRARCG
jgi:glycine oxidase